jgi:hypothetical protein
MMQVPNFNWQQWCDDAATSIKTFCGEAIKLIESFGYRWDNKRECWLNPDGTPLTPPKKKTKKSRKR